MKQIGLKIIFVLIFTASQTAVFAQNYTTKKTATGKAKSAYDEGVAANIAKKTEDALKYFTNALKVDATFIDAQIQQASAFYRLGKLIEAEESFEKVAKIDPNYEPEIFYTLGNIESKLDKNIEAAEHFETYAKSAKAVPEKRNRAEMSAKNARFKELALKNPVLFEPKSLGDKVNTPQYSEYLPALTADGETLIYTARVNKQEDFYQSKKVNGEWQKGEPMLDFNTDENEGAQCISADGRLLLYTVCGRPGTLGSCDIFYAQKKNDKWTSPKGFTPISSTAWESQPSISADGKTICFSSDRKGGLGGRDIWYIKFENGKWSEAKNMGKPINTPYDEQAPFIHPDGETLYFTSDGHAGMGGQDIYVSRLQDSVWSEPKNLGYPINTKENEGTLSVSIDGKTAFYARNMSGSDETKTSNYDLFSFELPEASRARPVTYVRAIVRDAETKLPLSSRLDFVDLKTQKSVISAMTDENGEFLICLPFGKNYALNVGKDKYVFQSENFNLTEKSTFNKPFLLEILLQPLPIAQNTEGVKPPKVEKAIILKNVFFETNKADLRSESAAELNKLKLLLTENSTMNIKIQGHTDNVGDDVSNQNLSERRAKAVADFLMKNGIAANRLSSKGFGKTQPIDTNDTPEGRQNNRRTEFVILK